MKQTEKAYNVENKRQIYALSEYGSKVRMSLWRYMEKQQPTMIAGRIGVNAAGLTGLITTNKDGESNRSITPCYLAKFIEEFT